MQKMLKIAYISPVHFSNVDISFISEIQQYCDVHYYALVGRDGKGYAINLEKCPQKSGLYKGTDFPEVCIFKNLIDITKVTIVYRKGKSAWHNIMINLQLLQTIKKESYDIVHITDFFNYSEWPLFVLKKKLVMSVHDPFLHSSMQKKSVVLYRKLMFKYLSHFIIFNRNQKDEFIRTYHLANKHVYISSLGKYSYLTSFPSLSSPSYHYALFFGKISGYKGLEFLLPAMKMVHETYPNYKLIVAGSGKFYFDISEYKNCDYIIINNKFYNDPDLVPLIAHADYVVCPYKDATQSGVIMSAYAFSKPCIVTNVGGLAEMVGMGKYGIIIPPCNTLELAKAMCTMIENENVRIAYSKEIDAEYSNGDKAWANIAKQIYKNVYLHMA